MMYTRDIRWLDRLLAVCLSRVIETAFEDDKAKKYALAKNTRFEELDGRGICVLHSIEGSRPGSY